MFHYTLWRRQCAYARACAYACVVFYDLTVSSQKKKKTKLKKTYPVLKSYFLELEIHFLHCTPILIAGNLFLSVEIPTSFTRCPIKILKNKPKPRRLIQDLGYIINCLKALSTITVNSTTRSPPNDPSSYL